MSEHKCYCICPPDTKEKGIVISEFCHSNWRFCHYVKKKGKNLQDMKRLS